MTFQEQGGEANTLNDAEDRIPVTVEVCLKPTSTAAFAEVKKAASRYLEGRTIWYTEGPIDFSDSDDTYLASNVQSMTICDVDLIIAQQYKALLFWQCSPRIYVYQLNEEPAEDCEEDAGGEQDVPSYREWLLPCREWHGLWESLYFDVEIKQRLLNYAESALIFADRGVDMQLVSWNRVVLLHGPPGTGKTSLCKALAQKLTVRLSSRYPAGGQLVEVNAHSLFSKWFSESGKLVSRLFAKVAEVVEEEDSLVFVLVDEVESLTSARKAAVNGSEPSDSIRAVNALLTQLDNLRRFRNVMVLTTSNITTAIDVAFVDRADIKAYIGPPSWRARYEILRSAVEELGRAGIIAGLGPGSLPAFDAASAPRPPAAPSPGVSPDLRGLQRMHIEDGAGNGSGSAHIAPGSMAQGSSAHAADAGRADAAAVEAGALLAEVAQHCEGFSGRALRKMPFLAHAGMGQTLPVPCSARRFLAALATAVQSEQRDRGLVAEG